MCYIFIDLNSSGRIFDRRPTELWNKNKWKVEDVWHWEQGAVVYGATGYLSPLVTWSDMNQVFRIHVISKSDLLTEQFGTSTCVLKEGATSQDLYNESMCVLCCFLSSCLCWARVLGGFPVKPDLPFSREHEPIQSCVTHSATAGSREIASRKVRCPLHIY